MTAHKKEPIKALQYNIYQKVDIDGYFDRVKPHIKGPAKGNAVYKVNLDTNGKKVKACKFNRHVRH